jgi:hypothetical protein
VYIDQFKFISITQLKQFVLMSAVPGELFIGSTGWGSGTFRQGNSLFQNPRHYLTIDIASHPTRHNISVSPIYWNTVVLQQECTCVPKMYEPPPRHTRRQNGDMRQVSCRGSSDTRRYRAKCILYGYPAPGICAALSHLYVDYKRSAIV